METVFRTLDLLQIDAKKKNLLIRCVAGRNGLDRHIESKSINRPGLALGGFFEIFSFNFIQIFGRGESDFINRFIDAPHFNNVKEFLKYEIPCCIFSNGVYPPEKFIDEANKNNVPILVSELSTADLINALFHILNDYFALRSIIHGVLVEVFGIGVLLLGKSGIGKSETALELIQRGHRLVADDSVSIRLIQNKSLMGESSNVIAHHMEIRGIGIIDIRSLFGIGAVRMKKRIHLIIELEQWDATKEYERIGIEERKYELMGVKIPAQVIPIMPGRNIPIIIETAAMNQRLKGFGVNSAKKFNKMLIDYYETQDLKNTYFNVR